jgi:ribosomal-protein-serine acetyltransferase
VDTARISKPNLTTRQLALRRLRPRDASGLFTAVDESRRKLRLWLPWVDATQTPDDTEAFIRRVSRSPRAVVWGIWEDARICGTIGLHEILRQQGTATLGYWIRTSCEGRGHATEASAAVLLWAFDFLHLERVSVQVAPGNAASLQVMDKLGFVREGVARSAQMVPARRQRLDWITAGMIRKDLRRGRRTLVSLCGIRRPWVD